MLQSKKGQNKRHDHSDHQDMIRAQIMFQNRIHNFYLPSTYLQASALVGSPTPIVYGDPIRISIFIPVLPTTRYPIQCIIVARSCGTSTGLPM